MSEPTTERYCVLVNGHAVEPGCWVDGHWGQYGPDHLADRAEELGWESTDDNDPRYWRKMAEGGFDRSMDAGDRDDETITLDAWEHHYETATDIERWLNDHTETEGYSWGWHDGEFFLWPTETWGEDG